MTSPTLNELIETRVRSRRDVWDALWARRGIGRLAVHITPAVNRVAEARTAAAAQMAAEPARKPPGWTEQWRESLVGDLASQYAALQLPGDYYPTLSVPRFVHGQSQGICDVFAARVEPQPDGNFYVHPLPADPAKMTDLKPRPVTESQYWGAVEWIRYARTLTGGILGFRNPIMTGPFDTANYLLGTTVLMQWVYEEPAALHALLDRVTAVIIDMLTALRQAAGGRLAAPHHGNCLRGGHDFASECRSLVSCQVYDEFESPYLRRIAATHGPYAIHSCGGWERTVPSALADPDLRMMNGQIRENDLLQLCELAQGRLTYSIGPSVNLPSRYTWPDRRSFLEFMLRTVPRSQPLELNITVAEIPLWNELCRSTETPWNCVGET
ncbi:MAG: hypothetical protein IT440_11280 [Phycisphaeraceae bacterium]|nr:hypothetical protein [Phycisphaeraceae bacterium]